ncbi:hypothetical protein CEXT_81431 [Caerostris extrusa]|uniref:Uncharacterized protein n=1 Tax=Caerostris extrusa TaxID=172846 RepID=A0AAV4RM29_CAEEX|nr:hypothetical protein CEXT_81431 [Caerostris extrusa]
MWIKVQFGDRNTIQAEIWRDEIDLNIKKKQKRLNHRKMERIMNDIDLVIKRDGKIRNKKGWFWIKKLYRRLCGDYLYEPALNIRRSSSLPAMMVMAA